MVISLRLTARASAPPRASAGGEAGGLIYIFSLYSKLKSKKKVKRELKAGGGVIKIEI